MIYVMSDLHGDLQKLKKMLKKIKFDPTRDKIIIDGDIMDRGGDDLNIYKFLTPYIRDGVVTVLLGNHEYFCLQYLRNEISEHTWIAFGAEPSTVNAIKKLNEEDRSRFYEYLDNLPYYIELEVDDKIFVITHSGLHADHLVYKKGKIDVVTSIEEAMKQMPRDFLISIDIHHLPASQKKMFDRHLLVGHVPVINLGSKNNHIVRIPYYTCIDGGVGKGIGGSLACLCLDTEEEFYVD